MIFWPSEKRKTPEIEDREETYILVYPFINRWRWCCGRFGFRQRALQLGYQRSKVQSKFL